MKKLWLYTKWVIYIMVTNNDRQKYATAKLKGMYVETLNHGGHGTRIIYDRTRPVEDNKTFLDWDEFKKAQEEDSLIKEEA